MKDRLVAPLAGLFGCPLCPRRRLLAPAMKLAEPPWRDDMKILSPSECSIWLKREDCCENPYGRRSFSSASSLQFATSRAEGAVSRMVHGIRTILGSPRSYLFQVTDWSRYVEHENSNLSDLESKGSGNPFDAWGIVFEAGEADEMFECCISVVDCGMSAYLYAPQIATILFWEGNSCRCLDE